MIETAKLTNYLNDFLKVDVINDYCPNGLQISGRQSIRKIVTAVSACEASIDAAIKLNADALLVHHGFFWKNESPTLTGPKRTRVAKLLANHINLYAYHLPLDVHPDLGNNACLAKAMNFVITDKKTANNTKDLLFFGELIQAQTPTDLSLQFKKVLNHKPLYIPAQKKLIKKIAWCTGAAQDFLDLAAEQGVDAYISGEISERTVYLAREYNTAYYAIGHHASERGGIKALGDHIAEFFDIEVIYFELDNPV